MWKPCPPISQLAFTSSAIVSFWSSSFYLFFQVDQAALKIFFRWHRIFSTVFNSRHKICRLNLSWLTKKFFNVGITIFTRLIRSMEKDFSHICQLWKMFRRIRNQPAAHAQKGDKCPLLSHDDLAHTSTVQDQEQPTRVATATRRQGGSLPTVWVTACGSRKFKTGWKFHEPWKTQALC